jgi:hypothetical protein
MLDPYAGAPLQKAGRREIRVSPDCFLASEMVEDFAGQGELIETLFFRAKFRRVGNERAAGAPRGMLDVQHLVKQDVLDDKLRDAGPVHAAIQQNLIGTGIIAAKLAAPTTDAPTDVGAAEFSIEIFCIELVEQRGEIILAALRRCVLGAHAAAAHAADTGARAAGPCVGQIGLNKRLRQSAAIDTRKQQRGGAFQDVQGSAAEQIRKPHKEQVFAAANGQNKTAIRIKLHTKMRGAPFASDARENAMEEGDATGDQIRVARPWAQILRLTGGGAAFFLAFSASLRASCVPSMASSRFSL